MFKDIPWYEWLYQVSDCNEWVKSFRLKRIIKNFIDKDWYKKLQISKNWKVANCCLHRLVALTFIPNPDNLPLVMHLDNDPSNNNVSNLKWWNQSHNMKQSYSEWRKKSIFSINNPNKGKLWKYSIHSKKVNQHTLDWTFIKTWDSIIDVERNLQLHHPNISKCCRWKYKSSGWFIWRYSDLFNNI